MPQEECVIVHGEHAHWISREIRATVHGDEGLIQLARSASGGDPEQALSDESFDSVSKVLWEGSTYIMVEGKRSDPSSVR